MGSEFARNRKCGLNKDVIVDAAYRMIDRDGLSTFTMRALGAELGVSAMAFYAHFLRAKKCLRRCLRDSWKRWIPTRSR